ncbi:MAG TPA: 4-hydroxy-tetrahydrodipicolinate reductase [Steroidobacteraceae bacterium]
MRSQPLVVFGITGRMGQALIRALREGARFHLFGAIASPQSSRLGMDAATEGQATGVTITGDSAAVLLPGSVALDFSLGSAVAAHAGACSEAGVPLLVGTTGFDAATLAALERAASKIAILLAPNTSIGVAVLRKLVEQAALALGAAYDIEIIEAHHSAKRDAPSGTALSLGEAAAAARGMALEDLAIYDRHAVQTPRRPGSIGFSSVRAADIVGEHTVMFAAEGERLELTHRATDRIAFARGALRAAAWLSLQPKGLYHMRDVVGL